MQVWKFGGTSVGKPERMHSIAKLITQQSTSKVVVLSAVSGTTNSLLAIGELIKTDKNKAYEKTEELYARYRDFIQKLYQTMNGLHAGKEIIDREFDKIRDLSMHLFDEKEAKELVVEGELLSTQLFFAYLQESGIKAALLPALDFMKIDEDEEPMLEVAQEYLKNAISEKYADTQLFVTQGYICRNTAGEIDNLKRGGSDYTASLIGAAIRAEEIQIWTDIDGMHNNDPRIVKKTFPIREISFEEAAELAYFGAKILHPTCIRPAQKFNIPVRLLNTMQPEAPGTLITNHTIDRDIKAIAAKDGITAINIHSSRMLLAYGFLRKVFEIFEKYKTSVDMLTTSEVAVSLTIDNAYNLNLIRSELEKFSNIDIDHDQTIICIVGDFTFNKNGIVAKVLEALSEIPLRMVSYGGSEHNISVLVATEYKNQALNLLNDNLFVFENA
ncbi:MAG: aspartate kinase [Verrucomicrobia bacterium]|nr:aspartate kinase [Cytophagales bacterium]